MSNERAGRETQPPYVVWRQVWPQRFGLAHMTAALVLAICALGGFAFAWRVGSSVGVIGYTGFGGVALCASWLFVRQAGFRWITLSPKLKQCVHPRFGVGIRIGPESLSTRVLVTALGACAVYYGAIVVAFWLELDSLLPEFRDEASNTVFAGLSCVAMGATALGLYVFRPSTGLEIYQDVVIRTVGQSRIVRIGGDVILPWSGISEIAHAVRSNHVGLWTTREPLIRLMTTVPPSARGRLGWDTDNYLELPAGLMAAEPNMIVAVLRVMLEGDERRRPILSQGLDAVFTPPPLRARFSASRKQR